VTQQWEESIQFIDFNVYLEQIIDLSTIFDSRLSSRLPFDPFFIVNQ